MAKKKTKLTAEEYAARLAERERKERAAFTNRKLIQSALINGEVIEAAVVRSATDEGYFEAWLIHYRQEIDPNPIHKARVILGVDSKTPGNCFGTDQLGRVCPWLYLALLRGSARPVDALDGVRASRWQELRPKGCPGACRGLADLFSACRVF
jgi:hypothetical protein